MDSIIIGGDTESTVVNNDCTIRVDTVIGTGDIEIAIVDCDPCDGFDAFVAGRIG
ncbi:hypothetical protein SDC9_155409 [bioreactor metagenome]|uniref:Uncharacterized protein n=1 Tax=bioreactor metagenome TaxID=1076179 RepID=A0A645F1H3_9ZZZZ